LNLKISIIIPSYNQGKFIEETISSILDQNYQPIELIIIDGGSTDNTVSILRKYDKFIKFWVSEKDSGQSNAINKGLKLTTGEIFAWQNSDDRYLPGAFEHINELMDQNDKIDLVFGGWNFIDVDGKIISNRKLNNYSLKKLQAGRKVPPQPAVFFRRSAIVKFGGINESLHQSMDYDLYLKIANKNNLFVTPRILGDFRIHQNSKTVSGKPIQIKEMQNIRKINLGYNSSLSDSVYWFYSDSVEKVKDYLHRKLNIFSLSDFFRIK
jgi:glycosyltransferase involved in cell wall biosynthesis